MLTVVTVAALLLVAAVIFRETRRQIRKNKPGANRGYWAVALFVVAATLTVLGGVLMA